MATKQRKASKTKERAKKSTRSRKTPRDIKLDREGNPHTLEDYRRNHWKIPASVYRVDERKSQIIHKTTLGPLGRPPTDPGAKLVYNESKGRLTPKGRAIVRKKQRASTKTYRKGKMRKQSYTQEYISAMGGDLEW